MKISKLLTNCLLLAATTIGCGLQKANASVEVSKADVTALVATCNSDRNQYEASLGRIRDGLRTDVQNMSQAEYDAMLDASDPRLILAMSTWPEILKEKDEMWKAYNECAEYHTEARKALNSVDAKRAEKKEAISALSDCLTDRYRKSVVPMSGLLKCYTAQVTR